MFVYGTPQIADDAHLLLLLFFSIILSFQMITVGIVANFKEGYDLWLKNGISCFAMTRCAAAR